MLRFIIMTFLLLSCFHNLLANSSTIDEKQLRAIQTSLKSFDDLSVDFSQKIYRSLRKKTSVSEGKAYFSKPNKFHWILLKPKQDEWLFNGSDLNHLDPKKLEAINFPANANKGKELRQIVEMVLNFDQLLKKFSLQNATKNKNTISMSLLPKTSSEIKNAELEIDIEKNYVKLLKLNFPNNNYTVLEFKNPSKKKIEAEKYNLPKGTKLTKHF